MSISLSQSKTAISPNITSSFLATGGSAPYVYSVRPNGAGGTINSATGLYTAPALVPATAATLYDTIQVRDNVGAIVTSQVLVGDPLLLFCEILQTELGLANGRVYLWDQKIMMPTDSGLYIAVSLLSCRPFGNTISHASFSGGLNEIQSINMSAIVQIDIISRDSSARIRKEEVLLSLMSDYSQAQQETNSFYIARLPAGSSFVNLSAQDGAAIPYRYTISLGIKYFTSKIKAVSYADTFSSVQINYVQK